MNYNINSSGLYDVNSYNLVSTNATILSSLNVSGLTTLSNDTNILGTLNVSGNALLHNFITMNSPLYINTNQTTTISALSVNSTSASILVNIVQNLGLPVKILFLNGFLNLTALKALDIALCKKAEGLV